AKAIETKLVEIPVIKEKIVKIPVVKEKIVTRTVYVYRSSRQTRSDLRSVSKQNNVDLNSSINDKEFLTQTDLLNFQPVSEIKPKITKQEE
ncbi:MAG: hypothetical protein HKN25_13855, partial [Pyrinomonadaceae bacterium]|nr:hypothetical protein [Pyrinomonadaceae bacterium]